jgi:hypothetical protein
MSEYMLLWYLLHPSGLWLYDTEASSNWLQCAGTWDRLEETHWDDFDFSEAGMDWDEIEDDNAI